MPAVSDTSPVSNLVWIGRLGLLRDQFEEILIPEAVDLELSRIPESSVLKAIHQAKRDGWLKCRQAANQALLSILTAELDQGEAEAIALAAEMPGLPVLIDERDGRALARQIGLSVTGVLGVLLKAKNAGKLPAIRPEIDALRTRARFFVAPGLERSILAEAGE